MEAWLSESVWVGSEYMSREDAMWVCIVDYLIPFVESKGYSLAVTDQTFFNRIAHGLYRNRGASYMESDWSFGHVNTDHLPEERWEFDYVFDTDTWKEFWSHSPMWSDLDEEGQDRQLMIQDYVWTQLNLDKSARTRVVYEHLGIDEDLLKTDAEKKRMEDTYIRESGDSYLRESGYRRRN